MSGAQPFRNVLRYNVQPLPWDDSPLKFHPWGDQADIASVGRTVQSGLLGRRDVSYPQCHGRKYNIRHAGSMINDPTSILARHSCTVEA